MTATPASAGMNRPQRLGFSVVELLVVVAILLILMGLMLPALSEAKRKGQERTCAGNLRSIAQGITLYQQDFDDYYPRAMESYLKPTCAVRLLQALECLSIAPTHQVLGSYISSPETYRCPLDSGMLAVDFFGYPSSQHPTSFRHSGSSYWYNEELSLEDLTATSIRYPSRAAIISDRTGAWHGGVSPLQNPVDGPIQPESYRGFKYMTAFADGHVELITPRQMNAARGAAFSDGDMFINLVLP